jgi:hypothetical protein
MKYLKQFLLVVAFTLAGTVASAQTCVNANGITTCTYNIPDDGHAIVPIPFGFPLYGHIFTHSIFFDNGAVSFYSPTMPQRWGPSWPGGLNISNNTPSSFFYSIIPLGTDLIANAGTHTTQGNQDFLRYNWNNVSQFGMWNSRNTFSVEIQPTGFIGINYERIEISGGATRGIIGNASLGEFMSVPQGLGTWSINETIATDCSNPLVNVNCPGYQQAFLEQQCSVNALYSPACPGYAQAYYEWQVSVCTTTPTAFNGQCQSLTPTVWFDYQCFLDPLYNNLCPGYADAFYAQQCSLDPLYDRGCYGYGEAYALKYIVNQPSETKVETVVVENVETVETVVAETTTPTATASPAETATAPVSLTAQPAATPQPAPAATTRTEPAARPAPTTRQAVAERRAAAAAAQSAQKARENPSETAEAMDNATSLEQQAEIQNVVLGAMGFVPGFDAYSKVILPDGVGYRPFVIYSGQRNVDTPAARGLLGRSDRLHQEMVDSQYK